MASLRAQWGLSPSGSPPPRVFAAAEPLEGRILFAGGAAANLVPYAPDGWSDKIVVSAAAKPTRDGSVREDETAYLSWAVANNGSLTTGEFHTNLYVDGTRRQDWYTSTLSPGSWAFVQGFGLGRLAAGNHTLRIVTDTTGQITESNESDNAYSRTISVSAKPPAPRNDHFSARKLIVGAPATVTGTNVSATLDVEEKKLITGAGGRTVWWSWKSPISGTVTLDTAGSSFDTILAVFQGSSLATLSTIPGGINDNDGGLTTSRLTVRVKAGQTYQIAVDGHGTGSIILRVSAPVPDIRATVSGTIRYQDQPFSTGGFVESTWKAVRYAAVALLDSAGRVLATTTTSASGAYSFSVTVAPGSRLRIRTLARSRPGTVETSAARVYTDVTPSLVVNAAGPTLLDRDIVTNAAAWNVMDMLVTGYRYALSWMSDAIERSALAHVVAHWDPGRIPDVRYDGNGQIWIGLQSDGTGVQFDAGNSDYDILHEYGHHVMLRSSTPDSYSGDTTHSLDQPAPGGMEMAWSEGFANFFAVATSTWDPDHVSAVGIPSDVYVRPFTSMQSWTFSLKTLLPVPRPDIEHCVADALWDLYTSPNITNGKAKLFSLIDKDLDGWAPPASPTIRDLKARWLKHWSGDAFEVRFIFDVDAGMTS